MKMVEKIEEKEALQKGLGLLLFMVSLTLFALGQPDRPAIFCYLSYFVGFPLFFYTLFKTSTKASRFFLALIWATGVELFFLSWFATTHYHGLGILVAHVALSLMIGLQFACVILVLPTNKEAHIGQPHIGHAFLIAGIWSIIEWSRLHYFCGFPFGIFGQVLTFDPIPMQIASVFGVYGLSFWVVFIAVFGGIVLMHTTKIGASFWVFLATAPFLFGFANYQFHKELMNHAPLARVALVQPGLSSEQKWEFPGHEQEAIAPLEQWKRFFDNIRAFGHTKYDLVVFPEVAFPGDVYDAQFAFPEVLVDLGLTFDRIPDFTTVNALRDHNGKWYVSHAWIAQALADLYHTEVVIGLLDHDASRGLSFNSAFHFVPFRKSVTKYNKRILVPMSEYLPLPFLSSFIAKFGINTFFTHGEKAAIFFGQVPMTVSICYEEGFNYLIREGRIAGAKLLVNVSNDGWFPNSRLPIEHFNLGKIRSIENGVPLVRSCNTGFSAMVNALGETTSILPDVDKDGKWLSGIVVGDLNCYTFNTVYSKFGNGLILLVSSLVILIFLLMKTKAFSRLLP